MCTTNDHHHHIIIDYHHHNHTIEDHHHHIIIIIIIIITPMIIITTPTINIKYLPLALTEFGVVLTETKPRLKDTTRVDVRTIHHTAPVNGRLWVSA
jgi:hypothetical protein